MPTESVNITSTLFILKRMAGVMLMLCFVLPLSHCEREEKLALPSAQQNQPAAQQPEQNKLDSGRGDKYAYQNISYDDPVTSALNIGGFFWPALLYFFGKGSPSLRRQVLLHIVEFALCAGSSYLIFGITLFGELRYGGYLAYGALATYFLCSFWQALLLFRMHWRAEK